MSGSELRMGRRTAMVAFAALALGIPLAACASQPVAPRPRTGPVSLLSTGDWKREFDAIPTSDVEELDGLSSSSDTRDHYFLAYGVDAFTMMFEATGESSYLDRALRLVENTVARARPASTFRSARYPDDFLTWHSASENDEEVPLYESYLWRYAFRSLRVLRADVLFRRPDWRARYDRLLRFGERNIFDKWFVRGANENVYRSRTHMASHWAFIAMNLAVLTGDPERRDACWQVKDSIDNHLPNYPSSLRGQMRPNDDYPQAYTWNDAWDEPTPQDVSHGNNVVSYVVDAYDLNQGWTAVDVARFGRTLDPVIWAPRRDEVAQAVDGSGRGDGWLSDGFVKLGRYDPVLQTRLQGHAVRDPQFVAAMALNTSRLSRPGGG